MDDFKRPQFLVALLIIGMFAWAYGENVDDDTMKGALIGAFNLAIGFYLGSVVTSAKAREQVGQALDLARQAHANTGDSNVIREGDQVEMRKAEGAQE